MGGGIRLDFRLWAHSLDVRCGRLAQDEVLDAVDAEEHGRFRRTARGAPIGAALADAGTSPRGYLFYRLLIFQNAARRFETRENLRTCRLDSNNSRGSAPLYHTPIQKRFSEKNNANQFQCRSII